MNEQNNENQSAINLIRRLYARFKNTKVYKCVIALVLAVVVSTSATACLPIEPIETESSQTNESNKNSGTNLLETTHGKPSETTKTTETKQPTQPEIEYSEILENILNNSTYNQLISAAKTNPNIYNEGEFKPHPYTFLQQEGFDIEKIMNGTHEAYTLSYVKEDEPNNLYMFTRVNNNSYISNYLLKYELTDEEMDDYDLVHDDPSSTSYFIQSVFMNNEISKLKTPEIVGKSKMSEQAFTNMTETMYGRLDTNQSYMIMTNPNKSDNSFNLILLPKYFNPKDMAYNTEIREYVCGGNLMLDGDIYLGPYTYGVFKAISMEKLNARLYLTQDVALNYIKSLTSNN